VASQDESLRQAATGQPMATEGGGNVSSEQILDQVRSRLAEHRIDPDNGQVTLRLHPQELGELKISVRMDDQRLRVEIVAENRTVKDALMQNIASLKVALARLNLEVKRFNVTTASRKFCKQQQDGDCRPDRSRKKAHQGRLGSLLQFRLQPRQYRL
ncbi:MAG: flagellar hook-length control protein FliK, partial [Bacteroidales bacterium]|nr:flagellar hook-length control protein FliK [Bacteroidales bacterium]